MLTYWYDGEKEDNMKARLKLTDSQFKALDMDISIF